MDFNGKKLYRNESNKMIAGVCSGLAEYFNIDISLVRLLFVAAFFLGSAGFWVYLVAIFVIPEKPVMYDGSQYWNGDQQNNGQYNQYPPQNTDQNNQNNQDGDPTRL